MVKSPHTPEFRANISQEHLNGSSHPFLAEKYNIGKTTLQQWAAKYSISSREVLRRWQLNC